MTQSFRALVPEDLQQARPCEHLFRAAACTVLNTIEGGRSPENVARRVYGGRDGEPTRILLRGTTTQATTATTGWAAEISQHAVRDLIASITSLSTAAELIQRGLLVDLGRFAQLRIPGRTLNPADAGTWLPEGTGTATVRQLAIISGATLNPRRLIVITSFTREMDEASLIEDFARQQISEASAIKLDTAVFGTQADDGATPQGILHGLTGLTPTAGGGMNALSGDIKQLIAALATNNAGKGVIFIAGPSQVASLKLLVGPRFDYDVLASQALQATSTVIALEPSSFVSAFSPTPEFDVAAVTTLAMDDTAPGNINAAAAAKSLFQTDSLALRMTLRAAFAMRAPQHVQYISGVTW